MWALFFILNLGKMNTYYFTVSLLVLGHFAKRLYESKYVHIFSNDTAPLIPSFKNFIAYWIIVGVSIPLEIFSWRNSYFEKINFPTFIKGILVILFVLFEAGNYYCHMYLRNLRLNARGEVSKERKVPKGLFFDTVVCPNYSFEILSWLVFVIISESFFSLLFIALGSFIMHKWGLQKKRKLLDLNITQEEKSMIEKKQVLFPMII